MSSLRWTELSSLLERAFVHELMPRAGIGAKYGFVDLFI